MYHLLVHADDVNLLGDNKDTIYSYKSTETSIDAGKEVGLQVNAHRNKSGHQNAGPSHYIKIKKKQVLSKCVEVK
jgi:hypothetical protein